MSESMSTLSGLSLYVNKNKRAKWSWIAHLSIVKATDICI